jgi:uncharacterized protein YcgL (UPF0745 family)
MSSLDTKRWLRALEIAKILFEDQGYHTQFLEEIEDYLREELFCKEEAKGYDSSNQS